MHITCASRKCLHVRRFDRKIMLITRIAPEKDVVNIPCNVNTPVW